MKRLDWLQILKDLSLCKGKVAEDPNVSIPRRPQQLGVYYGILWRSLHLGRHPHPYKVQLMQELRPADHSQRRRYMEWVLEQQTVMKHISHSVVTLINKIVVYGVLRILK